MRNFVIALAATVALAGCTSSGVATINTRTTTVVVPPDSLYDCPQVKASDLPNPDTLTNQQVSNILTRLYGYNQRCVASQKAIQNWIAEAKKKLES